MAESEKLRSNDVKRKILEEEKQAREVQSRCLMLLEELKEKTKSNSEKVSKERIQSAGRRKSN